MVLKMKRLVAEAMKNQFDSTFKMITTLIDVCPDDVWIEAFNKVGIHIMEKKNHNYYINKL